MSNRHIFDQIIDEVKNDSIPEIHLEQAQRRTLDKMVQKPSESVLDAVEVKTISGCEDFQKLIPAFIKNELSEARTILVRDHTRSCVPCRRFQQATREKRFVVARPEAGKPVKTGQLNLLWKVAASLVFFALVGLGYRSLNVRQWFITQPEATIVDGSFYTLSKNRLVLKPNASVLAFGEEIRAPRDTSAMFEMEDGTTVEVARRSIFKIDQTHKGITLNLLAGKAIVEAADQRSKHLFVQTPDCMISVKGTVFAVNSGPKGSRVSVFEGEVHVQKGKTTSVLLPGEQYTSEKNLKHIPLKREVSWSKAPTRLQPFLNSIQEATAKFEEELAVEGTRYHSRLLPLMLENTVVYGAIPNVGEATVEILNTIQEQVNQYPGLEKVLSQNSSFKFNEEFDDALQLFGELSSFFGNEIAFGLSGTDTDHMDAPLFLAESSGKVGLEDFVRDELAQLEDRMDQDESFSEHIVFIEDPQATLQESDTLFIWVYESYIAASPDILQLQELQNYIDSGQNTAFTNSHFFHTLDGLYQTGLSVVFGVDIGEFIPDEGNHLLTDTGINGVDNFIFIKREAVIDSSFEANITFKESRKGIASWLSDPSPLNSLTFLSPNVTAFASIALINPEFMLHDLLKTMKNQEQVKDLVDAEESDIMDLLQDLAVALGGEITIALDGPILPEPHWKVIAELYDADLLEETVLSVLMASNRNNDFDLIRETSDFNGLEVNEIRSQKYGWNFYYAEIEGYLLVVPNLSLLDQTLKNRSFNLNIASSENFISLLPASSYNGFSGLVYQDFSQVFEAAAKLLPDMKDEDFQRLTQIQAAMAPRLVYIVAEQDRISIASTGGDSLLNTLLLQLMNPETGKIDLLEKLFETPTVH